MRKKIQAIFVTHSHYDHLLDIGEVHKESYSKVFGSYSTIKIASASGVKKKFLNRIKINQKIKVGEFEIEVLKGNHPTHFMNFTLAEGKVDDDFSYPSSALSYKMDEVYSFLIKYKGKTIFLNASTYPSLTKKINVDIMIQGLAHAKNYNELITKQIIPSKTKLVIPSHHDNLFSSLDKEMEPVVTSDIGLFRKKI